MILKLILKYQQYLEKLGATFFFGEEAEEVWVTPSSAQELLLALHFCPQELLLMVFEGPNEMLGIEPRTVTCKVSALPTVLSI